MRRIAVINQKGGVGKTTTTVNLGAAFARRGNSVLLIDLDPQGHLTLHFGAEVGDEKPSIYDVLVESVPVSDVVQNCGERIAVLPADIDLAAAEPELLGTVGRELILREALDAHSAPTDFVLIDCPPSLGVLTINALAAVDEVLIPLQAHFFALQGLGKLLDTVTLVRQRINPKLRVSGIALCLHDSGTRLGTEVVDDVNKFLESARNRNLPWSEAVLYQTRIRRNIKLAEAGSFGKSVFDYDPKSHGAADYEALAAEVIANHRSVVPDPPKSARPPRKIQALVTTPTTNGANGSTQPQPVAKPKPKAKTADRQPPAVEPVTAPSGTSHETADTPSA